MTEDETRSDSELVVEAQAGQKLAFNRLVQRHKDPLFRFVRRYIGNEDDAYDIVQDTFISAWLALPRYDLNKAFLDLATGHCAQQMQRFWAPPNGPPPL